MPTDVSKQVYSIQQFCDAYGISRATFYRLQQQGQAPRVFHIGDRILISIEAAVEWRRSLEQLTAQPHG